jgi:hypothetical protein
VQPLGSHDWAFDCYMIHLAVIVSFLSLVLKIRLEPLVVVVVDAWCLERKCSGRVPPLGLATVLSRLWVLYGGLHMIARGKFVVCVWFGWLSERLLGLVLRLLGMSLRPETPFWVTSWVAFRGCSLELTNGGCQCWVWTTARLSSTNECDTKTTSTTTGHVASGMEFPANQFVIRGQGAHAGLFIVRVPQSYYKTTYPSNRVHSQGGNLDYYIRAPPSMGQ